MPEYDEVIKGLECHKGRACVNESDSLCPYWEYDDGCSSKLYTDAIELLKFYKPMVDKYTEWRMIIENPEPDQQPCPPMPKGDDE